MLLTGPEILRRIGTGEIVITPFNPKQLGPNSYNIRLAPELEVYQDKIIDARRANPTTRFEIPEEGLLLLPGELYLGRTVEYTETHGLVPDLDGRSSVGRLGINIHVCAGRGDVGFCGYWTLEITVTKHVRIYPHMEIGQLYYSEVKGDIVPYSGKYQHNRGIQASRLFSEYEGNGQAATEVGTQEEPRTTTPGESLRATRWV